MRKLALTLLTLLVVVGFMVSPAMAKVVRLALNSPPWSGDYVSTMEMAKVVKEKTNGAIEIKVFPSGQLGDMMSQLQQIQGGTLEMSVQASAVLQNAVPQFAVLDLPFVWPKHETAYAVLMDEALQDKFNSFLEPKGMAFMGYGQNWWRAITNSKRPIRKPEDLKGLKMRVMHRHIAAMVRVSRRISPRISCTA